MKKFVDSLKFVADLFIPFVFLLLFLFPLVSVILWERIFLKFADKKKDHPKMVLTKLMEKCGVLSLHFNLLKAD